MPDHVIPMMWRWPEMNFYAGELRVKMRYSVFHTQLHHDSRQVYRNLDVSCTIVEILWLAKCLVWRKLGRKVTKCRGVSKCRPVLWSSSGRRVPACICCRVRYLLFVKTVRTVRLRYAFTQIVMVRSHFHCRNTVSKYWYFSETTRSFQLASHPTQAAYGGWLETDGLTQVYTTKTTQITFFQVDAK